MIEKYVWPSVCAGLAGLGMVLVVAANLPLIAAVGRVRKIRTAFYCLAVSGAVADLLRGAFFFLYRLFIAFVCHDPNRLTVMYRMTCLMAPLVNALCTTVGGAQISAAVCETYSQLQYGHRGVERRIGPVKLSHPITLTLTVWSAALLHGFVVLVGHLALPLGTDPTSRIQNLLTDGAFWLCVERRNCLYRPPAQVWLDAILSAGIPLGLATFLWILARAALRLELSGCAGRWRHRAIMEKSKPKPKIKQHDVPKSSMSDTGLSKEDLASLSYDVVLREDKQRRRIRRVCNTSFHEVREFGGLGGIFKKGLDHTKSKGVRFKPETTEIDDSGETRLKRIHSCSDDVCEHQLDNEFVSVSDEFIADVIQENRSCDDILDEFFSKGGRFTSSSEASVEPDQSLDDTSDTVNHMATELSQNNMGDLRKLADTDEHDTSMEISENNNGNEDCADADVDNTDENDTRIDFDNIEPRIESVNSELVSATSIDHVDINDNDDVCSRHGEVVEDNTVSSVRVPQRVRTLRPLTRSYPMRESKFQAQFTEDHDDGDVTTVTVDAEVYIGEDGVPSSPVLIAGRSRGVSGSFTRLARLLSKKRKKAKKAKDDLYEITILPAGSVEVKDDDSSEEELDEVAAATMLPESPSFVRNDRRLTLLGILLLVDVVCLMPHHLYAVLMETEQVGPHNGVIGIVADVLGLCSLLPGIVKPCLYFMLPDYRAAITKLGNRLKSTPNIAAATPRTKPTTQLGNGVASAAKPRPKQNGNVKPRAKPQPKKKPHVQAKFEQQDSKISVLTQDSTMSDSIARINSLSDSSSLEPSSPEIITSGSQITEPENSNCETSSISKSGNCETTISEMTKCEPSVS